MSQTAQHGQGKTWWRQCGRNARYKLIGRNLHFGIPVRIERVRIQLADSVRTQRQLT